MALCAISAFAAFVSAKWQPTALSPESENLPGNHMYYDLLPRIKNAGAAQKDGFTVPYSNLDLAVAQILVDAGYLKSAEKRVVGKKNYLDLVMKYYKKKPAMTDFRLISKPSRHIYSSYRELRSVRQSYGFAVLSTPKGVMTNKEAKKQKVGGEYLFEIW
jgi:small subunit ribosomal protein S8